MYCSSCGNLLVQGMNYCKQCGAKTDNKIDTPMLGQSNKVLERLPVVLIAVAIFGFITTFLVMENLLKTNSPPGSIATALFFLLGTVFGIFYLILREISKNLEFNRQLALKELNKPVVIRDTAPQQIEAAKELISVTEHTTRNIDPVYLEKNSH